MYNIERETGVLVMSGRQRGLSLDSTNAHIPRPIVLTYSPRGRFFSLSTSGAGRPRRGGGAARGASRETRITPKVLDQTAGHSPPGGGSFPGARGGRAGPGAGGGLM